MVPQKVLWRLGLKQDNYSWAKLQIMVRRKYHQKKLRKEIVTSLAWRLIQVMHKSLCYFIVSSLISSLKMKASVVRLQERFWKHELLHFMEIRHSVIHIWLINQFAPLNSWLLNFMRLLSVFSSFMKSFKTSNSFFEIASPLKTNK